MIGVRSASALSVVVKKRKTMSLFVSRFGPEVTAQDIKSLLQDQLKLTSLCCTRLKTKFNSYASFHISVNEEDFPLINNTGVWHNGCLIAPFYGRLNADQIYRPDDPATRLNPNLAGGTTPPVFRSDRDCAKKTRGGGVLTATSSSIPSYKRRRDLESWDECVWIEIPTYHGPNLLIGNHYFPPDNKPEVISN
jgi:hypothetical protein